MNNHQQHQQYTATGYPAPPPPSSTGYPYAAPPPPLYSSSATTANPNPNPNPNSYYNTNFNNNYRSPFFRRFMVALVSSLIILSVILFIIWLVLRPKLPLFLLSSLSLSSLNTSSPSSSLSGNWTATFSVSNPNSKLHVFYDDLDGAVFFRSEQLAFNRLPPFDQPVKSSRNLTATFVASSAYVDGWVVGDIDADRAKGSVNFNLKILATVHFKSRGGWWSRRRYLRVFCDAFPVGFSGKGGVGTLTGGPRVCAVGV